MKKASALIAVFLLLSLAPLPGHAQRQLAGIRSWLCYYAAAFPPKGVLPYDLYVFQPSSHPALAPLKAQGARAVGYVSLGEVNKGTPWYEGLSAAGAIVEEDKDWPGAFRVDLRSERWRDVVLSELIPPILAGGFDGIFIDTIDAARYLEEEKKMAGSVAKAAELIREIRRRYPGMTIVLNNGLFLLGQVGDAIDALVVEDVFTLYDFKRRQYQKASPQWTSERMAELKAFQERFQKPVLTLDYLKASDRKGIAQVSALATAAGFVPYIADIHLETIFFHP